MRADARRLGALLPPSLNSHSGLAGSKKPRYGTPGERKSKEGQESWASCVVDNGEKEGPGV